MFKFRTHLALGQLFFKQGKLAKKIFPLYAHFALSLSLSLFLFDSFSKYDSLSLSFFTSPEEREKEEGVNVKELKGKDMKREGRER